ncbi:LysR family transcriptional regulator ArgP [Ponticoccus gilvus]|nr:LysR family transcriptional regulator ArgP [Enemella evansiae]
MRLDPAQLAALEAVLRLGSFEAAAAALGVTPSAISQRIRALEDRTGTPLVIRAAPAEATALGARLARHAREQALLDAALADELHEARAAARVRIVLNADSLDTWALPALADADLLYEIVVEDESISADRLRRGEVSAVVTTQANPVQGCDVIALGAMRYRATCAPAFHDRHFARGLDAAALARAPMLDFSGHDRHQRAWITALTGQPLSPPAHLLPSTHGFVTAAKLGLGWGLNPAPLVDAEIAAGRLRDMAPDRPFDVPLYWQLRSLVAPALRPLTRAMVRAAKRGLVQHAGPDDP